VGLDLALIAFLGGIVAVDRFAGWGFQLSQPLVAACLTGALVNPGPEWELWALRIPLGVGALLQLLLTDPALPAAQRPHETATAGVVGSAVALLGVARLHERVPLSSGGLLWVVVGTVAGLLAAWAGGAVTHALRARNQRDLSRVDALAAAGQVGGFEALHWTAALRTFLMGALWTVCAVLAGLAAASALLPHAGSFLIGGRLGLLFAVLLGVSVGAAYHAHVRNRPRALRWAALGALATAGLLYALRGAGT